jgi:hypothetical protein
MSGGRTLSGLNGAGGGVSALESDVSLWQLADLEPDLDNMVIGDGTKWITQPLSVINGGVTKTYVDTADATKQAADANLTALSGATPHLDHPLTVNVPGTANSNGVGAYQATLPDAGNVSLELGTASTANNALSLSFNKITTGNATNYAKLHLNGQPNGLYVRGDGSTGTDGSFTAAGYISTPSLRNTPTAGGTLQIMGLGDNLGQYNLQFKMENNVVGNVRYFWDLTNQATTYGKVLMFDGPNASFSGKVSGGTPTAGTHLATKDYVDTVASGGTVDVSGKADKTYVDAQDAALQTNIDGKQAAHVQLTALSSTTPTFSNAVTGVAPSADLHLATKKYVDDTVSGSTVDVSGKADTTYVDAQDTALQTNIDAKADKTYVDSQDTLLQASFNGKADTTYVDAQDTALQTNIDAKANKTYVDTQDTALQTNINAKADKTYVDTQDTTLQTAIDGKQASHANLTSLSSATPTVPALTVTNALKVGQVTGSQTTQTANDTLILGNGSPTGASNFFIDFPSGKAGTWVWGFNMPKTTGINGVMQVYNNSTDRQVLFVIDSTGTAGGDQRVGVYPPLRMLNPSGPLMTFYPGGVGAPTFTNRSLGTKISLRDVALTSTLGEWGFGVESGYSWSAVPDAATGYKWYAGTTNIMTLTGTGNATLTGTVTAATPTVDTHLATKAYVDTADATKQAAHAQLTALSSTTPTFSNAVTGVAPTANLHLATKKYVDDHAGSTFTGQIGMTYQKTINKSDLMAVNGVGSGDDIIIGARYKYDANPFFQTRNGSNCELRVTATFRIHSTNLGQSMKIQMAVHSAVGDGSPFPFIAYGKDQWVTLNQGSNASVVVMDNMKQSDYATEISEAQARGDLNPWVLFLTSPIWVTFRWTGVPAGVAWMETVEHLSVQLTEVSA